MQPFQFGRDLNFGWISNQVGRDFCGIELWTVMDAAGFSVTGFTGNIWFLLILRLVQATRNQLCPCGIGGSNPSLSAKSFHKIKRLQKHISRYPFSQNHQCRTLAGLIAASRIGAAIKLSNSGIE
jgi:hypothetical protein